MRVVPLPPHSTYLHHSHKGFRVFLEHILEGTGWKPQYCGWSGCSGWDRFIGSRVTLRESSRDRGLIHQGSNPIPPKLLLCCCLCLTDTSDHKKPSAAAPRPQGCNEGELTPALETGQGNKSSRELDQGEGSARLSALTQLYYRASLWNPS